MRRSGRDVREPRRGWPFVWWVTNPRFGRQIGAEEQDLLLAAERGFMTGELEPLGAYLKAGYPLDDVLRQKLIALIDGSTGQSGFHLEIVKNRRGRGDAITVRRKVRREAEIWRFVQAELRAAGGKNRGKVKAAHGAAAKHFGVSDESVRNACRAVDRRKAGAKVAPGTGGEKQK